MPKEKILLTGASGFVGSELLNRLSDRSMSVLGRKEISLSGDKVFYKKTMDGSSDYSAALSGVDVVIHSAGRAHVLNDKAIKPLDEFMRVNHDATINLASQAAENNVKRFIFISSIKVNGEETEGDESFSPNDKNIPSEPYALSKYKAEESLISLSRNTDMDIVIIRPPLIYGPGVKGNFSSLIKIISSGIPMPFGCAINNKRSLLALDNLVDFIVLCSDYKKTPQAANEIFLISDGESISTVELFQHIAGAYNYKLRLISIPLIILNMISKLFGKKEMARRLFSSLQVDSSKANELLNWQPKTTINEQLKKMAYVNSD